MASLVLPISVTSPRKPQTSQTALQPTDTREPSIRVAGKSLLIEAIVNKDPFALLAVAARKSTSSVDPSVTAAPDEIALQRRVTSFS